MNLIREGWAASVGKEFSARNDLGGKIIAYHVTENTSGGVEECVVIKFQTSNGPFVTAHDGQGNFDRVQIGTLPDGIPISRRTEHPLDLVLLKGTH